MENGLTFVRFVRGTLANFKALDVKDENTLYFIYDEDVGASAVYLGTRLITGNGEIQGASNLNELNDIHLDTLANSDILIYNLENSQWNNLAFDSFVSHVKDSLGQLKIGVDEEVFELTEDGTLKLIGFNEAASGTFLSKDENGKVAWVEFDTSELNDLKTELETVQESVKLTNDNIDAMSARVDDLQDDLDTVSTGLDSIQTNISDINSSLQNFAMKTDVYTKSETDVKIGEAVASVNHLKRVLINSLNEVDLIDENVSNYIYMIPAISPTGDDHYDEYMVIDGVLEKIGSWETDLSDYATLSDLNNKVDKKSGYDLVPEEEITKLSTIESGAQVNIIEAISTEFEIIDVAKILNLKSVPAEKIVGLDQHSTITVLQKEISDIASKLNTHYITKNEFNTELESLKESTTWTDI